MSHPVNPENTQTWANTITQWLSKGITSVSNLGAAVAAPMQTYGRNAWVNLGKPGSEQWESFSEESKTLGKRINSLAVASIAVLPCISLASNLVSNLDGITLVGAAGGMIVVGASTALVSWLKFEQPLPTALTSGAIASVGGFAAGIAAPALVAGSILGAGAAGFIGIATHMASNPGHKTLLPGGLEVVNPDANKGPPVTTHINPKEALKPLNTKISEFLTNCDKLHMTSLSWVDPQLATIERMKQVPVGKEISFLLLAQREIEGLGKNPSFNKKINAVARALATASFQLQDGEEINRSLIEKIEALPFDSKNYVQAKEKTDKQLDLIVKNGSLLWTLSMIHNWGLGKEMTDDVFEAMKRIAQEAAAPDSPSLWDLYRTYLGINLSRWSWFKARVCYALFHNLGIIKNVVNAFLKNVISSFRSTVEPKNNAQLTSVFKKSLVELTNFLELYLGAARLFSTDLTGGNLPPYLEEVIEKLGHKLIFERVKAALKPGEDLGKKMMEALCQEFTKSLIEKCMPKITLFEKAKKIPVIGFFLISPFAWVVEFLINTYAKKITQKALPPAIESMIKTGLENTSATAYPYKVKITTKLTELIQKVHHDHKNPTTFKKHRLIEEESPMIDGSEKKKDEVDGAADRILRLLKLKKLGKNRSKEEVAKFFNELDHPKDPETDQQMTELIADGANELMYNYLHAPEEMEELIGDLFELTNGLFKPNTIIPTQEEYKLAYKRLKKETEELLKDAVEDKVKKTAKGNVTQKQLDTYLRGMKDSEGKIIEPGLFDLQMEKGVASFEQLQAICHTMSANALLEKPEDPTKMLSELNHYVEILRKFAVEAEDLNIDLYVPEVKSGFNEAFYPIYKKSAKLAAQAVKLQTPKLKYFKLMLVTEQLDEIEQMILDGKHKPADLRLKLKEMGANYGDIIPDLKEKLTILEQHVAGIAVANEDEKLELEMIGNLAKLGDPKHLLTNLAVNPQKWNSLLRKVILDADRQPLFKLLQDLEAAKKAPSPPDLTPICLQVEAALNEILQKHIDLKEQKKVLAAESLTQFRVEAQAMRAEFSVRKKVAKKVVRKLLTNLETDTKNLADQLKGATLSATSIPFEHLPQPAIDDLYDSFGKPKELVIGPYLDAAFELITDSDIFEGIARLIMGNVIIETGKKSSP